MTWISNFDQPQIPVVSDVIPCPTARDVVVSSPECCPTVVF